MTTRCLATLLSLLVVGLWACGGDEGAAGGDGAAADAGEAPPALEAVEEGEASAPRRLVGVVVVGDGFVELEPCDGSAAVALQGPALPNLISIVEGISMDTGPVATAFADLVVTLRSPDAGQVPAGYERLFDVLGVRRAAYEGFSCDGPMPSEVALAAWGNEPFWNLVMREDSVAELSRPEEGVRTISVGNLRQDIEGLVLTGTLEGEGTVFVEVTTGTCQDSMSGALAHATAVLTIGGRRLEGCAWFGTELDPDVTPVG